MHVSDTGDIRTIEAVPLSSRRLPASTYAALQRPQSVCPTPQRSLSSFTRTPLTVRLPGTYAELLADVTRAANLFRSLGVDNDNPVAFALLNLPETHFTIWGGEAAGIVLAINPMLDAVQIADLLVTAKVRVLVTMEPEEKSGALEQAFRRIFPSVRFENRGLRGALRPIGAGRKIRRASGSRPGALRHQACRPSGEMAAQPWEGLQPPRDILPDNASSLFCTGGTTGAPKIAVRSHRNEVFDAWSDRAGLSIRR